MSPASVRNSTEVSNTLESTSDSKPSLPPKPPKNVQKKARQQYGVWDHFHKNEDDPTDPKAVCN